MVCALIQNRVATTGGSTYSRILEVLLLNDLALELELR